MRDGQVGRHTSTHEDPAPTRPRGSTIHPVPTKTVARAELGRLLDEARARQHLSIRAAAKVADVPAATVQGWLNGKHLPTPALRPNFEKLVEALGLTDTLPLDWAHVDGAFTRLRADRTPYVGLRPFTAADADLFFGRDAETRRLTLAIRERAPEHGLVALVGPSGSGKSSLLAAGLLGGAGGVGRRGVLLRADALAADAPGADAPASVAPDADLVVIDQFEDVLDLPGGPAPAVAAVRALAERVSVVLGVRADAFGRLAEFPELTEALEHPVILAPLTSDEVREAIVRPAALHGVEVEPGLVELILRDLAPTASGTTANPGTATTVPLAVLPLLSNALLLTWGVGLGPRMTVADYQRTGGLASAIEALSDGVFHTLSEPQQLDARRLFLELVEVSGEGVARRRLPLDAVGAATLPVVTAFVDARILTASDTDVTISHDALLRHWPRLASWLEEGRDELRVRDHLERAARLWLDNDRSPESLLPVDRLPVFETFLGQGKDEALPPTLRTFLTASREHFTSVLDAERATSARLRRQRRLASALAALAVCLVVVAGVSLVNVRNTQLDAQSRQVAIQAHSLRARDPNLQAQMAVVAHDLAPTRESLSALAEATGQDVPTRWPGPGSAWVSVSADQRLVARADGAGAVSLWEADALERPARASFTADPAGRQLFSLALAEGGGRRLLAVGGSGGFRQLWDVTGTPARLADLSGAATTFAAVFDPTGTRLALVLSDGEAGSVELWALDDPAAPRLLGSAAASGQVRSAAFDPTRPRLFVGGDPDRLLAWDTSAGLAALPDLPLAPGSGARVVALAASPDGSRLAGGTTLGTVVSWELDAEVPRALPAATVATTWVNGVSFSADSRHLVTGSSDLRVRVLDAGTLGVRRTLLEPGIVQSVVLVGDRPVATSVDGTLWAWRADSPVLRTEGPAIFQLATDAAATRWLAATARREGRILLWDLRDGVRPVDAALPPAGLNLTTAAVVDAAGTRLYSATNDGQVLTWELGEAGAHGVRAHRVLPDGYLASVAVNPAGTLVAAAQYTGTKTALARVGADGSVTTVATLDTPTPQTLGFSADGALLQVGIAEGAVQVWNVSDPEHPALVARLATDANPAASTFGPRTALLAAGTDVGTVYVWDVSDPANPREVHRRAGPQGAVNGVTVSPDERLLVAAGADEVAWAWDLAGGPEATYALTPDMGALYDGRFLDGGRRFAMSGANGTVRIWTLDVTAAASSLCALRGEPLTAAEWTRYLPGIPPADPCRR